jgi:predicted metal-dependent hydrolase
MALPFSGQLEVIRSAKRKKTITVMVRNGQVRILAPAGTTEHEIRRVLESRRAWIEERLQQSQVSAQERENWTDRTFLLYGKPTPVEYQRTSERFSCTYRDKRFHITGPDVSPASDKIYAVLTQWYQQAAEVDFAHRLKNWSRELGVTYQSFRVKDQRTRWGSCSSTGNINLNWRLIQAPPEVIDYVVVHELCHLLEMNHSPRFWAHVAKALPTYKFSQQWLKRHGASLYF